MTPTSVVIVGAGHAGVQAAASLREQGFDGEVVLLSAENALPYQRPPLSKAFLKGEMEVHGLPLRADAHFREQRIDLRLGVGANANRPRCAAGRAQRRRRDFLRPSHPCDGREATAARCSGRRSAGRVRAPRHRRRDRDPRASWRRSPRSSSSAPDSSGSKSPRPPRASGPRRRWSRSRARWAGRSRRSCRIFS